jgi:hypothetical protein
LADYNPDEYEDDAAHNAGEFDEQNDGVITDVSSGDASDDEVSSDDISSGDASDDEVSSDDDDHDDPDRAWRHVVTPFTANNVLVRA